MLADRRWIPYGKYAITSLKFFNLFADFEVAKKGLLIIFLSRLNRQWKVSSYFCQEQVFTL